MYGSQQVRFRVSLAHYINPSRYQSPISGRRYLNKTEQSSFGCWPCLLLLVCILSPIPRPLLLSLLCYGVSVILSSITGGSVDEQKRNKNCNNMMGLHSMIRHKTLMIHLISYNEYHISLLYVVFAIIQYLVILASWDMMQVIWSVFLNAL